MKQFDNESKVALSTRQAGMAVMVVGGMLAGYFLWPAPLVWAGLAEEPPACRFFDSAGKELPLVIGASVVPDGTVRVAFAQRSVHPPTLEKCFQELPEE